MKIILLFFCFLSFISLSAQEPGLDTNHGTEHTKGVESNSIKHSHSNHHHYGDHWEIPMLSTESHARNKNSFSSLVKLA